MEVISKSGKKVKVYSLIDEGSDTSLATTSLIRKLGLTGKKKNLKISGVEGDRIQDSEFHPLKVLATDNNCYEINVWTMEKICSSVTPTDWPETKKRWRHLADLDLNYAKGKIEI